MLSRPIEMICTFDRNGTVTPVRFRVDIDGNHTYNIEKYVLKFQDKVKRVFQCLIFDNGIKKRVEIWYINAECKWVLVDIK